MLGGTLEARRLGLRQLSRKLMALPNLYQQQ